MITGRVWAACAACFAVAGFTTAARAQGRIRLEAQSGVAIPIGTLRQYATYGAIGGLDVGYRASRAVTFHVTGSYVTSQGASVPTGAFDTARQAPGFRRWNALAGIESRLFSPTSAKDWWFTLDVDGGLAHLSSLPFTNAGTGMSETFDHTYPQAQGILRLRYDPEDEPRLALFVGAGARVLFAKQADTMMLTGVDSRVLRPFSTAVSVPVMFGLRVRV
jgi:hypothetical protein